MIFNFLQHLDQISLDQRALSISTRISRLFDLAIVSLNLLREDLHQLLERSEKALTKKDEIRLLNLAQDIEVLLRDWVTRLIESSTATALRSAIETCTSQSRSFSQLLRAAKTHRSRNSNFFFLFEDRDEKDKNRRKDDEESRRDDDEENRQDDNDDDSSYRLNNRNNSRFSDKNWESLI